MQLRPTLLVLPLLSPLGAAAAQSPKLVFDTGAAGERYGASIATAGDYDGDGDLDFAVGSPDALVPVLFGQPDVGGAVVVFDEDGNTVARGSGAVGSRFGAAVAGPLDRGSGDELVIGAPGVPGGPGRVWVTFPFATVMGTSLTVDGPQADDDFGAALALIDDVTGDGVDEIVVGAPRYDFPSIFGGAPIPDTGMVQVLSGVDGSSIATVYGVAENGRFGTAVCGVGDFDGDGREDFAVGAPGDGGGKVVVYSTTSPSPLTTFSGLQSTARFGAALARVDDVDGGGKPDLLVGSPGYGLDLGSILPLGRAAVVRGEDGAELFAWTGTLFTDFGHAVSTVDLEGDGLRDFVVHRAGGPAALARARVYSRVDGGLLHDIDDGAQDGASPVLGVASFDVVPGDELMIGLPDLDGERGGAIFYGLTTGGGPGGIARVTVDDDGPADFDSVAVAILSVPGGAVIEVEGGEYGPFTIDRPLSIVARHPFGSPVDPAVAPAIRALETGGVNLAGFLTESLELGGLTGRAHLSNLVVEGGGVVVESCTDVLFQNVLVASASSIGDTRDGIHALSVSTSRLHLTGCDLRGSAGVPATFTTENGGSGGDALRASASEVWVADTDLRGGDGAQGGFGGAVGGVGGAGVRAEDNSTVQYRGHAARMLAAGADGFPNPVFGAFDAYAPGAGNAVEHTDGLALPVLGLGNVTAAPPRPILSGNSTDAIGTQTNLRVMSDLGVPVYLALTFSDIALELPGFAGMPVWVDASTAVFDTVVVGQGYGTFVDTVVPIPNDPILPGLTLTAQAFAIPSVGDILPTNASQVIIRQ